MLTWPTNSCVAVVPEVLSGACKEFNLDQDMMQPSLFMRQDNMYLTVHLDDVFMVGTPQILQEFVMFLKDKKKWKVEVGRSQGAVCCR